MNALLDFESGWDRRRYDLGMISDEQLNTWARGVVGDFFDGYTSWSQLSPDEWLSMSCRSMNSLGFVGFQFGEALLIDLGYYQDDLYYLNGEAENLWDGVWTGRNGANSLDDFMSYDIQEMAICEAFGYNLYLLDGMLAETGQSIYQYIDQTIEFKLASGETIDVHVTMTGILAAAHLRGATGVRDLLQGGIVSADEYGTSILTYINQFGGFDSPAVTELIDYWQDPTPNPFGNTDDEDKGDQWICIMPTPFQGSESPTYADSSSDTEILPDSELSFFEADGLTRSKEGVDDQAAQDVFDFIDGTQCKEDCEVSQPADLSLVDLSLVAVEHRYFSEEPTCPDHGAHKDLCDLPAGGSPESGWEFLAEF